MTRIRYSRDTDALLVELSQKQIDYAEESGPLIVHFTREGEPVLLEILDAKDFLLRSLSSLVKGVEVTLPPYGRLTARELEVLGLLAQGMTNKEIAQALRITTATVMKHVATIVAKLEAVNRSEAIALAIRHGLVRPEQGTAVSAPKG